MGKYSEVFVGIDTDAVHEAVRDLVAEIGDVRPANGFSWCYSACKIDPPYCRI